MTKNLLFLFLVGLGIYGCASKDFIVASQTNVNDNQSPSDPQDAISRVRNGITSRQQSDDKQMKAILSEQRAQLNSVIVNTKALDTSRAHINHSSLTETQNILSQDVTVSQSTAPYPNVYSPPALQPQALNPSLWPDGHYELSMFRDIRAFQPLDVVTILVNESSEGKKKAETDAESKFSLSAAIQNLFGIETKDWVFHNTSLDPSSLVNVETESKYEGEGETKRSGSLKSRISAVVMEVLPNGLLQIEGKKIISVNNEEEIMVISGLVRPKDIDSSNEVESNRIANLRIDFFGKGVVGSQQSPGWGAKIFYMLWPF